MTIPSYTVAYDFQEQEEPYLFCADAASGDVLLPYTLPQAEYMYGCVPTSVGMLLGYYDLYGYNVNGKKYSLSNLISGTVSVDSRGSDGGSIYNMKDPSLLAQFIASEGYIARFYDQSSNDELKYSFVDGDPSKGLNTSAWDCLADYLGTGQYWRSGSDLSTTHYYISLKALLTTGQTISRNGKKYSIRYADFKYGLHLYVQSRGYELDPELTESFEKSDFSFADMKAEIDAGRPVLISMKSGSYGHMVIAYGYNASTNEIIFDDTYRNDCRMSWNGSYTYSGKSYKITGATTIAFSVDNSGGNNGGNTNDTGTWLSDYQSALKLAKEKNAPILLYYGDPKTCGYCAQLEKNVFSTAEFKQYATSGKVILLDNAYVPGLLSGTYAIPLCFLLAPDGSVIDKLAGYSAKWMDWFEKALGSYSGESSSKIDLTATQAILAATQDAASGKTDFSTSENVYLNLKIKNSGTDTSPGSAVIKIMLDGKEYERKSIPALNAGKTYSLSVSLGTGFSQGNHTWSVEIDPDNKIDESSETNNTFSGTFQVENLSLDQITSRVVCSSVVSNVTVLKSGSLSAVNGAEITNVKVNGGFFYVSKGAEAYNLDLQSGTVKVSSGGILSGGVLSGGSMVVVNYGSAEDLTVASGGFLNVYSRASATDLTVLRGGSARLSGEISGEITAGGVVTFGKYTSFSSKTLFTLDLSGKSEADPVMVTNFSLANNLNSISIRISDQLNPGNYKLADGFESFTGTITVCSTDGVCYQNISVGNSFQTQNREFLLSLDDELLTLSVKSASSSPNISSGGTSSGGIISSGGTSSGGIISSGGTSSGGIISSGGSGNTRYPVEIYSGAKLLSTTMGYRNKVVSSNYLYKIYHSGSMRSSTILDGGAIQVFSGGISDKTTISSGGGLHIYSGAQTSLTTVKQGGYLGIGDGATALETLIDYAGTLTVWGGGLVSSSTIDEWGAIILSSGALSVDAAINPFGGLHVYAGAVASGTLVKQNGFFGVGYGATAYDTEIDYAGALTVWGGGKVIGNTINQWGAIILSSGAISENTVINAQGGLHVYSGAVASGTLVNQSGFFGVGNGATTYDTMIGSAGSLTVWGGGVIHRSTIDQWGAIILSSGAVAENTVITPNGGLHIYNGASAYTANITSGANLGVGSGGLLAHANLQKNAEITFYDGAILAGNNNFNGTVYVTGNVEAAGALINFDLESRSADDDSIIHNFSNLKHVRNFTAELAEKQNTGNYRLAAGVTSFDQEIILMMNGIQYGNLSIGKQISCGNYNCSIDLKNGQLFLNVATL